MRGCRLWWWAVPLVFFLSGCSTVPAYRPPALAIPEAYKEAGTWMSADSVEAPEKGAWWVLFGDPVLDDLEDRIGRANPGMAAAVARYDAANAILRGRRAAQGPQIGVTAQITSNRQSDNRPLRGASQPSRYAADSLLATATYDPDLWGRVRADVAAGRAEAQAARADMAAVRLDLEARLALAYISLRVLDARIALLDSTIGSYAQADRLTRNRFEGGIASGMDVSRSGGLLAEARAQREGLMADRAVTEHAIASLVGEPASTFSLGHSPGVPGCPMVPPGVPSMLILRRPDIAAAERRVAAANARIGVARAAAFPSLSLGGSAGFQNTALADLLSAPNRFWSVGPGVLVDLFDGGRRRARTAQARAEWDAAGAAYRETALRAIQEVEDSLSTIRHVDEQGRAEADAVRMASQGEAIAFNRYTKGAVTYLDVVTAQAAALHARMSLLDLQAGALEARVGLVLALGGSWGPTPPGQSRPGEGE